MRRYLDSTNNHAVLLNELGGLPEERRAVIVAKQRDFIGSAQLPLSSVHPVLMKDPKRASVETMLLFGMINWPHTWFDPAGVVTAYDVADMVLERIEHPLVLPNAAEFS